MNLLRLYLFVGVLICLWFTVATAKGWRAVDLGFLNGGGGSSGYGRTYGGAWGGGK